MEIKTKLWEIVGMLLVFFGGLGWLSYWLITKDDEDDEDDNSSNESNESNDNVILVPMYIYPTQQNLSDAYKKIMDTPQSNNLLVIINPNNGNDAFNFPNSDWVEGLDMLASHKTIGYIYTSYGNRSLEEMKSNIDAYLTNGWDVQGFFFDETVSNNDFLNLYTELNNYVKSKSTDLFTIFNPGVDPESNDILNIPDMTVTFEGTTQDFMKRIPPTNKINKACIVHSQPQFDLDLWNLMKTEYQGVYLIEDDTYTHLPLYWNNLISPF